MCDPLDVKTEGSLGVFPVSDMEVRPFSAYAWLDRNRSFNSWAEEVSFMDGLGYELLDAKCFIPPWSPSRAGFTSSPALYVYGLDGPAQTYRLGLYAGELGYPVYHLKGEGAAAPEGDSLSPLESTILPMPVVEICAADLFALDAFVAWLESDGVATWHNRRGGAKAGEFSDAFITYDHGEGSDFGPEMPLVAQEMITDAIKRLGVNRAVIWLKNA